MTSAKAGMHLANVLKKAGWEDRPGPGCRFAHPGYANRNGQGYEILARLFVCRSKSYQVQLPFFSAASLVASASMKVGTDALAR